MCPKDGLLADELFRGGWGVLVGLALSLLLCLRIVIEEKALRIGLDGYVDYARRVPYRLIPHVWQQEPPGCESPFRFRSIYRRRTAARTPPMPDSLLRLPENRWG
jgi:hypothetical protein